MPHISPQKAGGDMGHPYLWLMQIKQLVVVRLSCLRLRDVEAIEVHHLVPRGHEVLHKRLLRVAACIDFRDSAKLGVGTEDEIDYGASPLEIAGRPITPL